MRIYIGLCLLFWTLQTAYAAITQANIKTFPNSFALQFPFNGVKDLYWTGMKTHRRVCFAASPSGKIGFVAYLDASLKGVHVQQVDLQTFKAIGKTFTVPDGREAGGLVVPDDEVGFALLTNEPLPSGTANAPKDNVPVPVLYRVVGGNIAWKRFVAGPGVHPEPGLGQAVDMNGDLVWSPTKKLFAAYFVISYYTGEWAGHFADSIIYVDVNGKIQDIPGASSGGGCSHNTGIAFAEADNPPFTSACAEDQEGGVWLNTKTQNSGSPSPLLSKEPVINGMSGEPFSGMGGSWKVLTRLGKTRQYAITWLTRNAQLPSSGGTTGGGNQPPPGTNQPTTGMTDGSQMQQQNTDQSTDQPTDSSGAMFRFARRATSKKPKTNQKAKVPSGQSQQTTGTTGTTGGQGGGQGGGDGGGGGDGTSPRNVAIGILTDKFTVGAKNIITKGPADHFNPHVQAFDDRTILSTYEEITNPQCVKAAGCMGQFTGTYFAQIDTTAKVVGAPFKSPEITVGGDLVLLPSGSICFPFVSTKWDYSTKYDAAPQGQGQQDPLTEAKSAPDNGGGGGARFRRLFRRYTVPLKGRVRDDLTLEGVQPDNGGGGSNGGGGGQGINSGGGGGGGGTATGTRQLSFACVSSPNGAGGAGGKTAPATNTATQQDQTTDTSGNAMHKRRLRRFLRRFS